MRKVRSLFRREKLNADMAAEMQHHLELQAERNRSAGMSAEEAHHAAQREFGNVASVQQRAREARGWVWLEQFGQDMRYAVRMLAKTPGVTLTAVITLALGIGVNAALFAIYDILALQPLPSRDPDQLVDIRAYNEQRTGRVDQGFSYPDYLDYRAGTEAFTDLVVVTEMGARLPEEAAPETDDVGENRRDVVSLQMVSGNYFSTLGAEFALGRDFLLDEAGLHVGHPVMVVSHAFWQDRLKSDPNVLGRIVMVEQLDRSMRTAYTIVGVAAPDFVGQSPLAPAGWIPLTAVSSALADRTTHKLAMFGRMRAGVSPAQAKADLDVIARQLDRSYPDDRRANAVFLLPAMRILNIGLDARFAMVMSPVLVGFVLVLVVSCLNVANLLIARGISRQHEIGVRLVLGASRGRLVRQLFAENVLLCALGAGAALLLAIWTLQGLKPVLVSVLAAEPGVQAFVRTIKIELDGRILGFGALLAGVAALTSGLVPALQSVRRDGTSALKQDGSAFGRKLTTSRLRGLLLVAQVAACLTLLAICGMMSGKLLRLRAADTGFATNGVYVVTPSATSGATTVLASDPLGAVESLRTMPGVASACMVSELPLRKPGGNLRSVPIVVEGAKPSRISILRVTAGFFESFGVPVVRGRAFTPEETRNGAQVVIVSEKAARRLWPGQEAVGKILAVDDALFVERTGPNAAESSQAYRDCVVIGVSRNFLSDWSGSNGKDLMLLPLPVTRPAGSILIRLESDSAAIVRGVEQAAAAAGMPVKFQEAMEATIDRGLWPYRAFARISGALTGLSLLLATVGLYGVVAFSVNQRTHEIGVRMALGATTERVTALFVRQGMRSVAYGVVLGLIGGSALAVLISKVMAGADFEGTLAFRCAVFAVVTVLLIFVSLLACWLPARRAAKVDPMVALRAE